MDNVKKHGQCRLSHGLGVCCAITSVYQNDTVGIVSIYGVVVSLLAYK